MAKTVNAHKEIVHEFLIGEAIFLGYFLDEKTTIINSMDLKLSEAIRLQNRTIRTYRL
jgi:hypothetical protein